MVFDLGILNGRIYADGGWFDGNLYIKDGKISALSSAYLDCAQTCDAAGKLVLPGLIDPHVHFALTVGKNTSKDDFYSGSIQAALGGVTTVIDFLDPVKNSVQLAAAFRERSALAQSCVIDYGFHACVAQPEEDIPSFYTAMRGLGMPTVKLFTTYSTTNRRTKDNRIDDLLRYSKEFGVRVVVHAENDDLVREGPGIPVKDHENARPMLCELTEVLKLAEFAVQRDGLLYIVHLNAGTTAQRLKALYSDSLHTNIILESCPHYFELDSSVYGQEDGYRYTMTPPLRSKEEQQKLRQHIGLTDVIATDHCPFERGLKQREYVNEIPMGIGGVRTSFSLMYERFGEQVIPKFTVNPAKIEGLYPRKGNLLPGADADVILFDPNTQWTDSDPDSVYFGRKLKGRVLDTYSKGRCLVKDGAFIGGDHPPKGEYLKRKLERL